MNTIITGASRGIGLELVHQALKEKHQVLAVVRDAKKSIGLQKLVQEYSGQVTICEAEMAASDVGDKILAAAKSWDHVDLLINNAGIMKTGDSQADFLDTFRVNTIAPYLVTKALLPLLKKSSSAKVIHITSKMGSIQDNTSGGYYTYRSSKTALNMINMSLTKDHPWLSSIVMHPGWVKTDMGGSQAPTEIADSVAGIWKVAMALTPQKSGRFYDFRGESLPW